MTLRRIEGFEGRYFRTILQTFQIIRGLGIMLETNLRGTAMSDVERKLNHVSRLLHQATLLQRVFVFRSALNKNGLSFEQKRCLDHVNEFLHGLANFGLAFHTEESLERERSSLFERLKADMLDLSEHEQKELIRILSTMEMKIG
ncbi:MAG: hypothetical protein EOP06_05285 [Proteobacteria bacterium]|nr:MAG: hypothetical protein EOP06_05285 [Pseudomonadota bacterium]